MPACMYACLYVCMDDWMDGWMDLFICVCMYMSHGAYYWQPPSINFNYTRRTQITTLVHIKQDLIIKNHFQLASRSWLGRVGDLGSVQDEGRRNYTNHPHMGVSKRSGALIWTPTSRARVIRIPTTGTPNVYKQPCGNRCLRTRVHSLLTGGVPCLEALP